MQYMENCVNQFPTRPALCVKRNGEWKAWTYTDYDRDARRVAKSLIKV